MLAIFCQHLRRFAVGLPAFCQHFFCETVRTLRSVISETWR
jgi:hypothetical protein